MPNNILPLIAESKVTEPELQFSLLFPPAFPVLAYVKAITIA
jgi:hypothetical protein